MTEIQQLIRTVKQLQRRFDTVIHPMLNTNEPEPFVWIEEAAKECRCTPSTITTYKARGQFKEGEDFVKIGRKVQYKVSAVMRELKRKKA